jgi:excisionase family DNA binding protein
MSDVDRNGTAPMTLGVPPELIEAVAQRTAELLADRLAAAGEEPWLGGEAVAQRTAELLADRLAAAHGAHEEPWLGVDQAAEYLSCPRARVYDLVAQRRVQVARDGRRLLFRREWLDALLEVESERAR